MKALSELLKEFDGRNKTQEQLEKYFSEIAKSAIYGGHFKINDDYIIRIVEVEFYFHSEDPNSSKIYDWGMYHRGKEVEYFTIGSLNPHNSGVDVTFERKGSYRASFLIRKYEVDGVVVNSPTYLREDLFGYTGVILGDGPKISWVNNLVEDTDALILHQLPRINVTAYDENGKPLKDANGNKLFDKRNLRFTRL